MEALENARLFWMIVERTLVELYHLDPQVARELVVVRRGPMTPGSIARNLAYHSQPLHIAYNLARDSEPIGKQALERYDQIVAGVTRGRMAEVPGQPSTLARENGTVEATESQLVVAGSH